MMWSLAVFLLGLLHAIQTVAHLYSVSGWSWLNYYNVTIFPLHYKSGLDYDWHWALAWLRLGLNESKCKMSTKATSNVRSSNLWQIQCKFRAIPDHEILANGVRKIRFNFFSWSNRHYCVMCGCYLNAVPYFVLWYFLICFMSSRRLLWSNKPRRLHCPVCSIFAAPEGCGLKVKSTYSDQTKNHHYVKAF